MAADDKLLAVSRHAAALFWQHGVAGTSGDAIAAAAGLSTRTVWRYFRCKESCVEPLLERSADRFLAALNRWPDELSLAEHLARDSYTHPLSPQDVEDERAALRISVLTATEPALRTAYLMVHDRLERGFIPVIATRLGLPENDLTVRVSAAAVTGAFRVIDEDVSRAVIVDGAAVTQDEVLALLDRAIREATDGRLGGPTTVQPGGTQ